MNLDFMTEAIRLARDSKGGPFGAVIVQGGRIIGRGANQVTVINDPTAHAEVVAIREACRLLGTFHLGTCELYSSCEPCPMCLAAILWARLDRIYFALTRQDAAAMGFDDEQFYRELTKPTMPMQPVGRDLALPLVTEWNGKADKHLY
jgi:tRNA(Arg) A34 adenosine deaminase TadA